VARPSHYSDRTYDIGRDKVDRKARDMQTRLKIKYYDVEKKILFFFLFKIELSNKRS